MSAMTLRLPPELDERLHLVAEVLGWSVSDTARAAVEEFIRDRMSDEGFRASAQLRIDRMSTLLAASAGSSEVTDGR